MRRLAIVAIALLAPALALAQSETTGTVTGTIMDADGAPIAGALVAIEGTTLQGERSLKTDERGRFTAALLPVGNYRVVFTAPGKKSYEISFPLGLGKTVDLPIKLETGQDLEETVVVYGDTSPLETTEKGENFSYSGLIDELPVFDRDIGQVALLAPNVIEGPTPGTIQIAGAPSFDSNVLLDGSEISDPFFGDSRPLFIEEAVEETQVLTGGVSARYGRFTGGVVNAITKSGGNQFDGTVRVDLENQSWNAKTPFGEDQADELGKTFSATLGGYLLKDRLWFFLAGRQFDADTAKTPTVLGDSFVEQREDDRVQLKLKGAITANHVIEGSYLRSRLTDTPDDILNSLPAAEARAVSPGSETPRDIYVLSYQGVLSQNAFLDVQGTVLKEDSIRGGDPALGSAWTSALGVFNNSLFNRTDRDVRDNETLGASLTWILGTENAGTHTLEGGAQYVNSRVEGWNLQSPTDFTLRDFSELAALDGNGNPLFGEDGDLLFTLFSQDAFRFNAVIPPGLDPVTEIENTALYLQDTWEFGNWRLDAGLRWEQYDNNGPLATQNFDFSRVSPRLGVTYNITPDWQVQGTYGRYVAQFSQNHFNSAQGVQSAPRFVDFYLGPDLVEVDRATIESALANPDYWLPFLYFGTENDANVIVPGTESSYADDFNFAVKRAMGRSGSWSLTYTHRAFRNLLDDYFGGDGPDGWVTVVDPKSGFEFEVDQIRWQNNPDAERVYDAVTLAFDYRPGIKWNLGGNIVWSQLQGNYEGEAGNQPGIGSQEGDFASSTYPSTLEPYGRLAGDVPWRARLWGNYRFDFGRAGNLNLGAIGRYSSGFNYSLGAFVDYPIDDPNSANDWFLLGLIPGSYTYTFGERGSERFDDWWALDLSARYQIPFYRDLSGWIKLAIENVTNEAAQVTGDITGDAILGPGGIPAGFQPGPLFSQALSERDYQTPRSYLLSVGVTF